MPDICQCSILSSDGESFTASFQLIFVTIRMDNDIILVDTYNRSPHMDISVSVYTNIHPDQVIR